MPFNYPEYTYELFNPLTEQVDFWVDHYDSSKTQNFFPARNIQCYDTFAIIWRVEGDGAFQVDFQQEAFADKSMIFLAPGQYFHLISGQVRLMRYRFRRSFFPQPHPEQWFSYGAVFARFYGAGSIRLRKQSDSQFRHIHERMMSGFTTLFSGDREHVQTHIQQLLKLAYHEWQLQVPSGKKLTPEQASLLFRLKLLLDEHYMKNYSDDDFAEKLHVSTKNFRSFLTKTFSQPLTELIQQRRILEAKRQLCFSDTTFRTMAYRLGFSNESHFIRAFKKETRLTAHNFRKEYGRFDEGHLIERLLELINRHFRQELKVKFYAAQLGMEEQKLQREILRLMNRSVQDLIQQRMVLEIQREIIFTEYSISYIATRLNFLETGLLSRFFEKATGASPNEFRSFWDRNPSMSLPQRIHRFGTFRWHLRR